MSKKLYAALVPLLLVVAFAAMPAMASAAATEYGVTEGAAFKPFTATTKVLTKKTEGSGNFILKASSGAMIECKGLTDTGSVENKAGVGLSAETLTFGECFTVLGGLDCKVVSTGGGANIVGTVTDKVITQTSVSVTITSGFALIFNGTPTGCPTAGTAIGTVTGTATGTQAVGSNSLVFTAATGLKIAGEAATITGSDETETESKQKVVVGPPPNFELKNPDGAFTKVGEVHTIEVKDIGGPGTPTGLSVVPSRVGFFTVNGVEEEECRKLAYGAGGVRSFRVTYSKERTFEEGVVILTILVTPGVNPNNELKLNV